MCWAACDRLANAAQALGLPDRAAFWLHRAPGMQDANWRDRWQFLPAYLGDRPQFLPTHHGFDEYLGLPYSNDMLKTPRRPADSPRPLQERSIIIPTTTTSAR